eukprot:3766109-Prymnesium_polylepis.1
MTEKRHQNVRVRACACARARVTGANGAAAGVCMRLRVCRLLLEDGGEQRVLGGAAELVHVVRDGVVVLVEEAVDL